MKITLSFHFLTLFILTTTPSLLLATSDVIYDSAGNKLLRGVPYYILPLLRGTGGGLTLSRATQDTCPLDVTQEPFQLSYGVPFIFTPIVLEEEYVHVSYPVSIAANVKDPCRGTNIWKVPTLQEPSVAQTVTASGEYNTPESCFQVVEDDMMPGLRSYTIQLCPFKCALNSSTSLSCYNLGVISNPDGKRYLAPTDEIFPVVFANSFTKAVQSEKR